MSAAPAPPSDVQNDGAGQPGGASAREHKVIGAPPLHDQIYVIAPFCRGGTYDDVCRQGCFRIRRLPFSFPAAGWAVCSKTHEPIFTHAYYSIADG